MSGNRNNPRFNKFGFSIEDLETFQADLVAKFNPNDQKEYETFVKNIWDGAQSRLIVSTGTGEADRFVARQLLTSDADKAVDGLEFLTARSNLFRLWGSGDQVLAAKGQGTLIVGPQGVVKSTLAQLFVFTRMRLLPSPTLLDYAVAEDDRPILYLALDRPDQIAQSMARMVDTGNEDVAAKLKRQLIVKTTIPFKADLDPDLFAECALETGRDPSLVVCDSVKDVLTDVNSGEAGSAFNTMTQILLANGTDTLGLHHQRKANQGNPKPDTLSDVYGSNWITAGQGSVILLWGTAGASSVELSQIKPIREPVSKTTVNFNHVTGLAGGVDQRMTLLYLALAAETENPRGLTIDDAVKAVHDSSRTDKTWKSHSAKVKRFLEKLVLTGELVFVPGKPGGSSGGVAARWTLPGENFAPSPGTGSD